VASSALVALFDMAHPGLISLLYLSTGGAWAGQWWRFITFLFVPPGLSPLFLLLWLYVFYLYAHSLEAEWGAFRFTLYYGVGALATMAVAFTPEPGVVSNAWLNASLFLAFAALFPDVELLLFFVLPVKVKWLGYIAWASLIWALGSGDLLTRLSITAALLNYFLFFGPELWQKARLRVQVWNNRRRWKP
jgi:hypothetical protein